MLHRKGLSEAVTTPGSTVWTFGDIDDLSLSYSGNQLRKAADRADSLTYADAMDFKDGADRAEEYTYDANGNMTSDRNRGLHSIAYNVLNLPQAVRFADGHETRYTYDADGRKLRVEHLLNNVAVIDGEPGAGAGSLRASGSRAAGTGGGTGIEPPVRTLTTRDYCAGHVYCNGTLERVLNDAGYRDSTGYHFYVKDYRGDVRAVVADDGTLEEVNSYYPYGMLHGPSAIAAGVQPHKYTGKELDRQAGLDLYDFEARHMDPALGRATTQDPMAEKYYSISPYAWCASNPISHTDPTGCIVKYDMTEKEYGVFKENFDMLKQSEIFNNFFSALENNPDITVTIGFGKTSKSTMKNTDDEVPGEYDPETKMVTFKENQELASSTVAEELYHAYQDMSGTLVDGKENVEYEAKVAAILSCGDASTIISHIFRGIEDLFFDKLSIDYVENRELLQSEFRSTYVQEGQKFVEFFKQNSMSTHYSMPVTTVPDTLLKVLNLK